MKHLISLVNSMKPGEVQLIQHLYSFKKNNEYKKRDRLLNMIINKEVTEDENALFILYGDKSFSAFSQLKTRLREDIMSVLLMQDPTSKYTALCAQAAFDCRRAFVQGELLLGRGVYGEALAQLTRAAKLACKYELYAEQLQIDDLMRNHLALKQGAKSFNELSRSISTALDNMAALERIKYKHYLITTPGLMETGKDYSAKGLQLLNEMEEDLEKTSSARMKFYYNLAALEFYSQTRNYDKALAHGITLLDLVENDPVVNSRANIAGVNMGIASVMLNLERNKEAVKHATQSLQLFKQGMFNELTSLHSMFFAYFRDHESEKAREVLDQAMRHKHLKGNTWMIAQWNFINAAFEFSNGNYNESLKILKKDATLTKEKGAWQWGYYMLEIMIAIELTGGDEWVDQKIEGLKKLTNKNIGKIEHENPRCVHITGVLVSLRNHGYDFYQLSLREKPLLKSLADGKLDYHWDPTGAEMIRVDEWISNKIRSIRKAG